MRDVIRVDGARIPPPRRQLYLMFHKPRGVVSTMDDPQGRTTIADYLVVVRRTGCSMSDAWTRPPRACC